jgi:hypothetical protein
MIELQGQKAELRFTLEITRKETGKVEQYELIGHLDADKLKENYLGRNPQHDSPRHGD